MCGGDRLLWPLVLMIALCSIVKARNDVASTAAAVYSKHRSEMNDVRGALEDGVPLPFSADCAANLSTTSRQPNNTWARTQLRRIAVAVSLGALRRRPGHAPPATTDHTPLSVAPTAELAGGCRRRFRERLIKFFRGDIECVDATRESDKEQGARPFLREIDRC